MAPPGSLRNSGGPMQDVLFAFRTLRKQPGFTIVSLVTLALGIGATTVAFTVLDTVLLRALPYANSENLVFMQEETDKGAARPPSFPNFVDWRAQSRSLQAVASAMYPFSQTVVADTQPVRATVMGLSLDFLGVLGVQPFRGREFTSEENRFGGPRAAMVTHEFWATEMGSREPLGSIRMDGEAVEVV